MYLQFEEHLQLVRASADTHSLSCCDSFAANKKNHQILVSTKYNTMSTHEQSDITCQWVSNHEEMRRACQRVCPPHCMERS